MPTAVRQITELQQADDFTFSGGAGDDAKHIAWDNGTSKFVMTAPTTDAPTDAEYVVLTLDGTLSAERVLTGTANQITITDGGAGANVTLATPQDIHTSATPTFDSATLESANGVDYNPGSDTDADLITVGVTGAPVLKWDESENAFDFSTIIALPTTSSTVGQIKQNGARLMHTYGTENVFIGKNSGNFTLNVGGEDGSENAAVGENTLQSLTTGRYNMAFGLSAGAAMTEGAANIMIGRRAGVAMTTGSNNVCIGNAAGWNITTGISNFCLGSIAGLNMTEGSWSVLIGVNSGGSITTGNNNVGVGEASIKNVDTGTGNIAIGSNAGTGIESTSWNVAIGWSAMASVAGASDSVAIGREAGKNFQDQGNVAIGRDAGFTTTGSFNVFLGYNAGRLQDASNQLYIANSNTADPLIYGEFDNDHLEFNAAVFIQERAAAITDKAGYGQLWVKNTSPCELWFTDDAGTDTQIV